MQTLVSSRIGPFLAAACGAALILSTAGDQARAQQLRRDGFKAPATGTLQHPGHGGIKQPSLHGPMTGINKAPPPKQIRDHRQPGFGCQGSDTSNASGGTCVKPTPPQGPFCANDWWPKWLGGC